MQKLSAADHHAQEDYGRVAQNLLHSVSYRNMRTIIRHLAAVVDILTRKASLLFISAVLTLVVAEDIPFVLRMVIQSKLPDSPPDIAQEAETLSWAVKNAPALASATVSVTLNELCPACKCEIPLQDITQAICPKGHTWREHSCNDPCHTVLIGDVLRTMLGYDFHFNDSTCEDLYWVYKEGIPTCFVTGNVRCTLTYCAWVGRGGTAGGST